MIHKTRKNKLAEKHAQKVLGKRCCATEQDAEQIKSDFLAGFKAASLIYQHKFDKWNELDKKIGKFCEDHPEESSDDGGGLITIGEMAMNAFKY